MSDASQHQPTPADIPAHQDHPLEPILHDELVVTDHDPVVADIGGVIDESAVLGGGTDVAAPVVVVSEPTPTDVAEPDESSERAVLTRLTASAARGVVGVHDLGTAAARAVGSVVDTVGSAPEKGSQGVRVAIDNGRVDIAISLVVDYPAQVPAVVDDVRLAVSLAITHLVGDRPHAIDVTVVDVHVPSDDTVPTDAAPVEDHATV